MTIDTADKRKSAVNWFCRIPPVPDGNIGAADRAHIAGFYRGAFAEHLWLTSNPTITRLKSEGWFE
jgi:hypothetical protein